MTHTTMLMIPISNTISRVRLEKFHTRERVLFLLSNQKNLMMKFAATSLTSKILRHT